MNRYQIVHDKRTDKYVLGMVMFSDAKGTDWFAYTKVDDLTPEMQKALKHPIIETTSTDEELDD